MALDRIKFNIASFNDADAGGNNYYAGIVYEVFNSNDTLADIYSDAAGANPINQDGISNKSNSIGEAIFYIDSGDYYIKVNEKVEYFSTLLSSGALINNLSLPYVFDTVADFKVSSIEFPDGKTIHLRDRGADFTKISGQSGTGTETIPSVAINQSITIVEEDILIPEKYGATGLGDNAETDNEIFEILFTKNKPMLLVNDYLVSKRFTTDKWVVSGGGRITLTSTNFGFLTCTGSNSIIEGITFKGAGNPGQVRLSTDLCLSFNNYSAQNNTVRNCHFKDFTFYAIELKSKGSTIEGNRFDNIGYWAIISANRFNYITHNTFVSCAMSTGGSYVGGCITVSYIESDGYTMATTRAERNYILYNTISTTNQVGIDTHSGYNLVIVGNIISDAALEAIYLHRTSYTDQGLTDADGRVTNCIIEHNSIKNCFGGVLLSSYGDDAIESTGCVNNIIQNNLIENTSDWGITLARGSRNNTVQDNEVIGGTRLIYIFYWCTDNLVKGNKLSADNLTRRMIDINANSLYSTDDNIIEDNYLNFNNQTDVRGVRNRLGCEGTLIKNNEFFNRGNYLPILDDEAGTLRQARIVYKPRGYTAASSATREISDMQGEVIENMLPIAGGNRGWICVTSGDEASTTGVWKEYGTIEA